MPSSFTASIAESFTSLVRRAVLLVALLSSILVFNLQSASAQGADPSCNPAVEVSADDSAILAALEAIDPDLRANAVSKQSCKADGFSCKFSFDCCSNSCTQGQCGNYGSCKADGASCKFSFDCCSNSCTQGQCGNYGSCKADGASCKFSFDCCSNSCTRGQCGGF